MKIGFWEIVVVLIVALVVIGPDKLPEYMKQLGKGMASLRKATSELNDSLQDDVVKPLNEASKPLREAADELNETTAKVNKAVHDVQHPVGAMKEKAKEEAVKQEQKAGEWKCPNCGTMNTGRFCNECGTKKPEEEPAAEEKKDVIEPEVIESAPVHMPGK